MKLEVKQFRKTIPKYELKECPTCKTLKKSNPTPEGDEICPNCGDKEMLDLE